MARLIPLILFLLISAGLINHSMGDSSSPFPIYGVQFVNPSFKVTKNLKFGNSKFNKHILSLKNDSGEILNLEILYPLEKTVARNQVKTHRSVIAKAYSASVTPYPGEITRNLKKCDSKYGPKIKELNFLGQKISPLSGAVDRKLIFGACTPFRVSYQGTFFSYFQEKEQRLWIMKYYFPSGKDFNGVNWIPVRSLLKDFKFE